MQKTQMRYSRYTGLTWRKQTQRWVVRCRKGSTAYFLGEWEPEQELEAALAALTWRKRHNPRRFEDQELERLYADRGPVDPKPVRTRRSAS